MTVYRDIIVRLYRGIIIPCTFAYLRYLEKIKDGETFHLTVLLLHPHVQRRQHQRRRPLSLISIPRPNINLNWQYGKTLDIKKDKWLFVLEYRHSSEKLVVKRRNTSNMFTYISEQHPSVQIQLCPIYNLILKSYDFRDAAWIPESSRDN